MIFSKTGQEFLWKAIEPAMLDQWSLSTMDNGGERTLIYENQFNTAKYTIKIDKKEKFKDLDVEELLFSDKIEVIDLTRYYWSGSVADIDFDNESLKEIVPSNAMIMYF